jgi:hypothetical protein
MTGLPWPKEQPPMSQSSAPYVLTDPQSAPDSDPADERTTFTRPRQVTFLAALAATGSVRSASARVGVSHQTAYRARLGSPGFRRGWDAALLAARAQAEEVLASRALDGWEEDVLYHGEVVASRRRYSDRLLLAHLARLDRLCTDPELAEFADRFDDTLARYAAGEDRPARVDPGVPAEAGTSGGGALWPEAPASAGARGGAGARGAGGGFSSPEQWSMRSTAGDDGAEIPPPLPRQRDTDGTELSEAQALNIGFYAVWWHEGQGRLLTNWPAPPDWAGEAFARSGHGDELVSLADDPDLAADLAALDEEGRAEAGWVRTLTPAEEAGLAAGEAAQDASRAARRNIYHRAAFGLATPAELAALAHSNPHRAAPWLAEVSELTPE